MNWFLKNKINTSNTKLLIEDNNQIFDKYGDHTKALYDKPIDENNHLDEQLPECINGIELHGKNVLAYSAYQFGCVCPFLED